MKKNWLLVLAVAILAACSQHSAPTAKSADTGGSRSGDFGPPQGEPVDSRADGPAAGAARHQPQGARQGHRRTRGARGREGDRRGREVHVLDLRRHRARQLHPRAPGRHGRVPSQEPSRQQDASQHRPARRHRARWRRGVAASPRRATRRSSRSRRSTGPLRVPLRHGAGRHARRQRHVRPHPRRAARRPAAGRPRVLRDAGRLLHGRQVPREGPAALRHAEGHRRERDLRALQRLRVRAHRTERAPGEDGRERSACSSATAARISSRAST